MSERVLQPSSDALVERRVDRVRAGRSRLALDRIRLGGSLLSGGALRHRHLGRGGPCRGAVLGGIADGASGGNEGKRTPRLCAGRPAVGDARIVSAQSNSVRQWGLRYRAHNKILRWAVVVAPAHYGPDHPSPPLPLVISPHGRGVRARTNANLWRDLPGQGGFAVICPGGMGRRLPLHSWGWRGQIDDLARMPGILRAARPWLRLDLERVYAVGGSMGGQETLLLLGQHPRLLCGSRRLRFGD